MRIKQALIILSAIFAFALYACGDDDSDDNAFDETCYDCFTVCEGTEDDERIYCLAKCDECQGKSSCFNELEGSQDGSSWNFSYLGMMNRQADWESVDCETVDIVD